MLLTLCLSVGLADVMVATRETPGCFAVKVEGINMYNASLDTALQATLNTYAQGVTSQKIASTNGDGFHEVDYCLGGSPNALVSAARMLSNQFPVFSAWWLFGFAGANANIDYSMTLIDTTEEDNITVQIWPLIILFCIVAGVWFVCLCLVRFSAIGHQRKRQWENYYAKLDGSSKGDLEENNDYDSKMEETTTTNGRSSTNGRHTPPDVIPETAGATAGEETPLVADDSHRPKNRVATIEEELLAQKARDDRARRERERLDFEQRERERQDRLERERVQRERRERERIQRERIQRERIEREERERQAAMALQDKPQAVRGYSLDDQEAQEEAVEVPGYKQVWQARPLGFGISKCPDGQPGAMVSSVQRVGEERGVKQFSKILSVNGKRLDEASFFETGKFLQRATMPLTIVFQEPQYKQTEPEPSQPEPPSVPEPEPEDEIKVEAEPQEEDNIKISDYRTVMQAPQQSYDVNVRMQVETQSRRTPTPEPVEQRRKTSLVRTPAADPDDENLENMALYHTPRDEIPEPETEAQLLPLPETEAVLKSPSVVRYGKDMLTPEENMNYLNVSGDELEGPMRKKSDVYF